MEFFLLLLPLLIFIISVVAIASSKKRKPATHGVDAYPILGHLPAFLKNGHRFLDWTTELITGSPTLTIGLWTPGQPPRIITADPANVEHLLSTNFSNYPKGAYQTALLQDFLGSVMFNTDGESWRWQRKTAISEFTGRCLHAFVANTLRPELVKRLLPLLTSAAAATDTIDLEDVLGRFGVDAICMMAFGCDPGSLADDEGAAWRFREFISAFRYVQDAILLRFMDPRFMDTPEHTDDQLLRDIVIGFMLAGRETTATALTWFFWLLSTRPDVEARIVEELRAMRAASGTEVGEPFAITELRRMHYLHAAITETLRLFPPVPIDTMDCFADDVMPDGTFVCKGWLVSYSAHAMGRSVAVWGEDCEDFRPDRWLDDSGEFRAASSYRYPVFHGGPRQCLGKELAYLQMKSIAACILEGFHIDVVGKAGSGTPEHVLSFTMRMKGGLPVKLRARCA